MAPDRNAFATRRERPAVRHCCHMGERFLQGVGGHGSPQFRPRCPWLSGEEVAVFRVGQKPGAPPSAACPRTKDVLTSGVRSEVSFFLVLGLLAGLSGGDELLVLVGPAAAHRSATVEWPVMPSPRRMSPRSGRRNERPWPVLGRPWLLTDSAFPLGASEPVRRRSSGERSRRSPRWPRVPRGCLTGRSCRPRWRMRRDSRSAPA
jgi:hypothetical protein